VPREPRLVRCARDGATLGCNALESFRSCSSSSWLFMFKSLMLARYECLGEERKLSSRSAVPPWKPLRPVEWKRISTRTGRTRRTRTDDSKALVFVLRAPLHGPSTERSGFCPSSPLVSVQSVLKLQLLCAEPTASPGERSFHRRSLALASAQDDWLERLARARVGSG
jgi:hypothetical protein